MRRTPLAVLVVVLAIGVAGPAGARASGPIVYEHTDLAGPGITTLWSVLPGDAATQITRCGDCLQEGAEISPDGSRVFFDSDLVAPIHVFSSKPDGSDVRQVTFSDHGFEGYPTVSPDGAKVAYDGQADEAGTDQGIWVARVDGTGTPERLTVAPRGSIDTQPAWSPDGRTMAFERFRITACGWRCRSHGRPEGFKEAVYLMDRDGSHVRRLTPGNGRSFADPSWAPDSRSLLVQSYDERGTRNGISADEYTIGADGRALTAVTRSRGGEFWFSGDYSPDGKRIALMHIAAGADRVDVVDMAADASDAHVVATCDGAIWCDNPHW